MQILFLVSFPCFLRGCDRKRFERVTSVVSVLCHEWRRPLTLAMSGR